MRGDQGPLTVRADAAVPATEIARLLARLSEIGVGEVALATQTGPR
jgi:biopolymer transport protein ExbD